MIGPAEVARRLGVSLDFSPGLDCSWNGRALHMAHAREVFDYPPHVLRAMGWTPGNHVGRDRHLRIDDVAWGYRIYPLNDYDVFHELAHVLLCPADRITKKDFGFFWNPDLLVSHVKHFDEFGNPALAANPPEHDQEENATEILGIFMMLYCGYNEEILLDLVRSFKKDPVWLERGISFEPIWEAWELFRLMMETP